MTPYASTDYMQFSSKNNYHRKRLILAVFIVLAVLVGSYLSALRPLLTRWFDQEKHYYSLKSILEQKQQAIKPLQSQQSSANTLQQTMQALLQKMPDQNGIQDFLNSLSKAGTDKGLVVNLIKPLSEQTHDAYSILPLQMTVTGTYPQIVAFINQIAQFDNIMTFPQFTITHANPLLSTAMNNAPDKADTLSLTMDILLYINNKPELAS